VLGVGKELLLVGEKGNEITYDFLGEWLQTFFIFVIFCSICGANNTKPYGKQSQDRIRIRIIYLMSGTQGVVTQSPEPGAHDIKCLTELKKKL